MQLLMNDKSSNVEIEEMIVINHIVDASAELADVFRTILDKFRHRRVW